MKITPAVAALAYGAFSAATTARLVGAYPELQQTDQGNGEKNKQPCPFGSRQTEEALAQANEEAAPRIAAWEGWETSDASSDEEPLVERLYTVGEKNDDEEFCSGDSENKFCDKINGPWGDSIPQNGTYCIWAMLEFQDELAFNYGGNNTNMTTFLGAYQGTLDSLPQGNGEIVMFGGSLGMAGGQPHAVPWPTASIVWADGNKHAKPWIQNVHRPFQESGYSLGFTAHTHFKAVKCEEINSVLTDNGLFEESMSSVYWIAPGFVISGTSGFRRYWNAFSQIEDHGPTFYDQAETCVLAPCPENSESDTAPGDGGGVGALGDDAGPSGTHEVKVAAPLLVAILATLFLSS
eukprot:CAMPEP_0113474994 /NCGR_PEP_ID=MMETSP0014_2-20120614/18883_1 /TAXON_ID=2857 /ORGANISM="Nitzschia sp." /LENGTH=349 /DNA_ID=CAMNT_0000367883 /DNA_START=114 /DNA_END=1160 /DNA_ORIENTATION=- /assembly_acc=CAM_ASM_000159